MPNRFLDDKKNIYMMKVLLINGSPKGSLCALLDRVFYSLGCLDEFYPVMFHISIASSA